MDETINEIMSLISPIVAAELGVRVKAYLKEVVPGGVTADAQIIKLTKEAFHELLDDIQGSISTDIDLAQANLETEIDNDSFVSNIIWENYEDQNDEFYEEEEKTAAAVTEKTKEVSGCQCSHTEPDVPEGSQNYSLDYDWADITYK